MRFNCPFQCLQIFTKKKVTFIERDIPVFYILFFNIVGMSQYHWHFQTIFCMNTPIFVANLYNCEEKKLFYIKRYIKLIKRSN